MATAAESTGARAAMTSAPGSAKVPGIVWPKTLDGAHQRLDFHEGRLDDLVRDIGEEPQPVSGKPGSGLMLFLHRVHVGQQAQLTLDEAEMRAREKWRMRWTLLATFLGLVISVVTTVNAVRGWLSPLPQPAPAAAQAKP